MKKFTKFLSVFMTAIMTLGMLLPNMAFAADEETGADTKSAEITKSVTLHKLLMTDEQLNSWVHPEDYNGTQNFEDLKKKLGENHQTVTEIAGVFFAVKNAEGKFVLKAINAGTGFNETTDDAPTKDTQDKYLGGLTLETGLVIDTTKLSQSEPTEYEIVELLDLSTYVGKDGERLAGTLAVPVKITLPLVNNDGVVEDAHVYPKNTENKPEIDKNYEAGTDEATDFPNGADYGNYELDKDNISRQIGDVLDYDVLTKIPADTKYKVLRWEDTMSKGLTFKKDSVTVTALDREGLEKVTFVAEDYSIKQNQSGFVLTMTDKGLAKVEKAVSKETTEKNAGQALEIRIAYKATINTDAVVDVKDENEIIFEYGNNPTDYNEPRENEVTPNDNKIEVNKTWADGTVPSGIEVTYYLYEKATDAADDKVVAMVVKKDSFNHTFTSEVKDSYTKDETYYEFEDGKKYYIKETVSRGHNYDAAYDVTGDGVVSIKNTKNETNPGKLVPGHPTVITHGKKFVKTNATGKERLEGAEFVIKNEAGLFLKVKANESDAKVVAAKTALDNAVAAYNELSKEDQDGEKGTKAKELIETTQKAYNEAFIAARTKYEWIEAKDATAAITAGAYVLVSNEAGQFEITGLDAGSYTLVETKAPEGYALPAKAEFKFEVKDGSYTSGKINYDIKLPETVDAQQVINKKVSIPQTGGIGTAIFIIAGIALMGGAFVAMKKQEA